MRLGAGMGTNHPTPPMSRRVGRRGTSPGGFWATARSSGKVNSQTWPWVTAGLRNWNQTLAHSLVRLCDAQGEWEVASDKKGKTRSPGWRSSVPSYPLHFRAHANFAESSDRSWHLSSARREGGSGQVETSPSHLPWVRAQPNVQTARPKRRDV